MLTAEQNDLLTKTGPGTPLGELFRRFWVPCVLSSEVAEPDGPPARVTIMGEDLIAFRDSTGRVGIVDAYCAHRGAPLFFGRNEECGLRCVYHGWKYDADGRCVDMPNEPATSRFKDHVQLKAYPTREAGGLVWAYMGPAETPPELPGLEWLNVPDSHVYIKKYRLEANYLQALEGDHDSSHVSALHSALDHRLADDFINTQNSMSQYHAEDRAPKLFVLETEYGLLTASRRDATDSTYLWRLVPWLKPFFSMIAVDPGRPLLLNIRVPIDDESSWFYRANVHPERPLNEAELTGYETSGHFAKAIPGTFRSVENLENDYLVDREVQRTQTFSGIRSIPAQDQAVTERARPFGGRPGTLDRAEEHLASADAAIVKIRQLLLRAIEELQEGKEPALLTQPDAYRVRATALELSRDVPFEDGGRPYLTCQTWQPRQPGVTV